MVQGLLAKGFRCFGAPPIWKRPKDADAVLLLNEGKLLYSGSPKESQSTGGGTVFLLSNIQGSRRALLTEALRQRGIIDGVIQGNEVRIVTKEKGAFPIDPSILKQNTIHIEPAVPRFEDAFIDILGGGPGGWSLLAEKTIPIEAKRMGQWFEAIDLTKKFGSFTAARSHHLQYPTGRNFRPLGAEWGRKIDDFQNDVRFVETHIRESSCQWIESAGCAKPSPFPYWLYGSKIFSLWQFKCQAKFVFFSGIYNLKGPSKERE